MHLQDHAGRKTTLLEGGRNAHHRDLNQVRRRPLQRRIGRRALAERADVVVAILELRDVAPPSKQCLDIPLRPSLSDGAIEPRADAGEPREVLLDELFRFILGDAELTRERERALPVNGRKIDRLGPGSHLGRHLVLGDVENDGRGLAVDVPALREGLDERGIAREMRQQTQLDLRVIGRQQHRSGLGDEGPANASPRGVRTGMFWRFGSEDDNRPVAAPAWLKLVWMRPVAGLMNPGRASTYVDLSFDSSRYSMSKRGTSCPMAASCSSTS